MPDTNSIYIWRCAKCSFHFANVIKINGMVKQEKKCPKCKSINVLTLTEKEIILHCRANNQDELDSKESGSYNNYADEHESNYSGG